MPGTDVLDQATLTRLLDSLGGDVEFLEELVDAYLDSTPELFATMRQAAATGDGPALQRAAHSLKTGSAGVGALALAAQCKQLEDMGRSGDLTDAAALVDQAAAAYDAVAAALRAQVS